MMSVPVRSCWGSDPYHRCGNFLSRTKTSDQVLILPQFLGVTFSLANHAGNHLRLDGARGHGVDPNALFGEFKRGAFAQTVHGVLAGYVNPGSSQTNVAAD